MNLYFRLILAFIRGFRKPRIHVLDELTRTMHVLPNDIDMNGHLNNGRYSTILDLFIIESTMRTGMLPKVMKKGWKPMFGGTVISFRRQLAPFEKYRVSFQIACWDERWVIFKFQFIKMDGSVAAFGYTKGAFVGSKGLVEIEHLKQLMGWDFPSPDMPEAVELWLQSESSMNNQLGQTQA